MCLLQTVVGNRPETADMTPGRDPSQWGLEGCSRAVWR
jgi:hypothetical protein